MALQCCAPETLPQQTLPTRGQPCTSSLFCFAQRAQLIPPTWPCEIRPPAIGPWPSVVTEPCARPAPSKTKASRHTAIGDSNGPRAFRSLRPHHRGRGSPRRGRAREGATRPSVWARDRGAPRPCVWHGDRGPSGEGRAATAHSVVRHTAPMWSGTHVGRKSRRDTCTHYGSYARLGRRLPSSMRGCWLKTSCFTVRSSSRRWLARSWWS